MGIMQKKDKIDVFGRDNFVKKIIDRGNEIVVYERPIYNPIGEN